MDIKIEGFVLKQESAVDRFTLVRLVQAQRKGEGSIKCPTGEFYEKEIEEGYSMTLECCIKKIIFFKLKEREEVVSLEYFLQEYKKLKEELVPVYI